MMDTPREICIRGPPHLPPCVATATVSTTFQVAVEQHVGLFVAFVCDPCVFSSVRSEVKIITYGV